MFSCCMLKDACLDPENPELLLTIKIYPVTLRASAWSSRATGFKMATVRFLSMSPCRKRYGIAGISVILRQPR